MAEAEDETLNVPPPDCADQLRRARFHERENFDRWKAAEAVLDALGVEQWAPEDADTRCQQCNRPNVVWFADNDLWNAVVGDDGGILCPLCFALAADASPQRPRAWRLVAVTE